MFGAAIAANLLGNSSHTEEDPMYAQAVWFDGPRSAELVAANDRAGLERIEPAVRQDAELIDQLVATIVMRRADGGELVVTITETEDAIDRANEVIMSTPLLPGEDPALLLGPDRFDRYEVVHTILGKATLR
jgi:hypothetical protein